MVGVKAVKIDGEIIHIFNSAIYIYESTLQLDMIVTEVVVKKYKKEQNLFVEIELDNGQTICSIMHLKILAGGLPQLHLFCELDEDYEGIKKVTEDEQWFPNIEEGITIEEIRQVEMPNEDMNLKLNLPINQAEWLKKKKKSELNDLFKQLIYEYWDRETNKRLK